MVQELLVRLERERDWSHYSFFDLAHTRFIRYLGHGARESRAFFRPQNRSTCGERVTGRHSQTWRWEDCNGS